ncbi:MAG: FAD-dependent oxidoreductase [Proteobacteria bacterium]|nr:FAD-dependent oxidoreductase [Pseudomonadota bacterium]
MNTMNIHTVIAGAGISGIRAAFDLAELGHRVVLLDKAPSSGGILSQLDHQFPDNHCGMCTLLPMIDRDKGPQFCLRKGIFHDHVTFIPSAEIVSVKGPAGQLSVVVEKQHTGIDPLKCMACGSCESVCPVSVPDGFNEGYSTRKAVFLPVPHQIPNHRIIDFSVCTRCGECVKACPVSAINLDGEARKLEFNPVNAVILATGSGQYDPAQSDLYGFGVLPNVVTSKGLERIMSSSGPSKGQLFRPSDNKPIKRMAFLQCVGSRNLMENADHCSSVCCMFAVKEAVMACEKSHDDLTVSIFYMDMRTFGRDFQRYKDQAETSHGLRFIRCRVHSVEPCENTDGMKISYVNDKGMYMEETVDLVVLSTGKKTGLTHPDFYQNEGVFALSDTFDFKDIGESLVAADVAAGKAMALGGPPHTPEQRIFDTQRLSKKAMPLLVLCQCGNNLSNDLDLDLIESHLSAMPGAPQILKLEQACGAAGFESIGTALTSSQANRVVIAACNPFLFDHKIKALARDAQLPDGFFKTLDMRSHVTGKTKNEQTQSLLSQIKSTVNSLNLTLPVYREKRTVTPSALVVGGGPAGLSAAFCLASAGIDVDLLDKESQLGGNGIHFSPGPEKNSLDKLLSSVTNHPKIRVHPATCLTRHQGLAGVFTATITTPNAVEQKIPHGAAIVATGGGQAQTLDYCASQHNGILSVFDLAKGLGDKTLNPLDFSKVVMIQCAGTREEPRNYCSRICCTKALLNAIAIKEANPSASIHIFYRDMMSYGESEKIYTRARQAGILFIPFDLHKKPQVAVNNQTIHVTGFDPVLQEDVQLAPDLLVLSTGIVPTDNQIISKIFHINTTQDGFLKEANSKWRPVDSGREGIFVCGLARAPLGFQEAMDEGISAAMRALRILGRPFLETPQVTARVRHSLCSRCQACIPECPYQARYLDEENGKIMVDSVSCQGCGACASLCPNSSIMMGQFEEKGIMDSIEFFLNEACP